ncbi:MAG: DMT family transporter [Bacteroidota bacterium]|nr:DMT family transporter [Bacteroidota bacterium]
MNNHNVQKDYVVEFWLLLVVVIWATNYPIAKYGLMGLNPFVFNSIRYIVATSVICFLFIRYFQWTPVDRSDMPKLFRAGIVASVIYQLFFIIGLSMTTAGNSAVLLSTSPLWTVFLNARLHKEKIRYQMWIGMVLSLSGIVMIIIGSGKKLEFGGNDILGDIISLIAAALWALNTTLQKPLLVKYPAPQFALIQFVIGAVGLSLIALPSAISIEWESIHWSYYFAAIVSGTLSIGIANLIWSHGIKKIGPGRTANFGNLIPVIAFIVSYFTLHEDLLIIQFIGAGVTILGVWVARK